MTDQFDSWLDALEKRHLRDLTVPEVNRAVRALSDDYVHRRHRVPEALGGRGKRAAFALFFGPLHFLTVQAVARELNIAAPQWRRIIDLGCGTGASGAAVAGLQRSGVSVVGVDRQGWTLDEAAFTYRHFGLPHRVRRGDVRRPTVRFSPATLIVAGYTVNEVEGEGRRQLLEWLLEALDRKAGLLVVEPIAKAVTPWWSQWSSALQPLGARAQEWRFTEPLPAGLRRMDKAAGLDHQVRTARTLWIGG